MRGYMARPSRRCARKCAAPRGMIQAGGFRTKAVATSHELPTGGAGSGRGRIRDADHPRPTAGPGGCCRRWELAAATVWFATFLGPVAHGEMRELVVPWVPALGIDFAFRLDGLALAFALLICGIGAWCSSTPRPISARPATRRLLLTLVAFAIVDARAGDRRRRDDPVRVLGGHHRNLVAAGRVRPRAGLGAGAALQALLVTGLGGLALLAGLWSWARSPGPAAVGDERPATCSRESGAYPAIFWLVIVGCFAKSAQFPFQFWLPNAMAAPTPVSAYLHSATMVKAGIYLMARLRRRWAAPKLWFWTLIPVGGLAHAAIRYVFACLDSSYCCMVAPPTRVSVQVQSSVPPSAGVAAPAGRPRPSPWSPSAGRR